MSKMPMRIFARQAYSADFKRKYPSPHIVLEKCFSGISVRNGIQIFRVERSYAGLYRYVSVNAVGNDLCVVPANAKSVVKSAEYDIIKAEESGMVIFAKTDFFIKK